MWRARLVLPALMLLIAVSCSCGGGSSTGGGNPPLSPDFQLGVNPQSVTINPGASGTINVSVTGQNGFTGQVSVSISGVPEEVTPSPANFTLAPGAQQAVQFSASNTSAYATSTVKFTGTSATADHSASLTLTVQLVGAVLHAPIRTRYIRSDSFYNPNALEYAPPHFTAYDAADKRFFVSNPSLNRIDVFDAGQETLIAEIPVPGAWGIDISADNTKLFAGTFVGDLYQIDPAQMQVVTRTPSASIGPNGFLAAEAFALANGSLALMGDLGQETVDGYHALAIWNPTNNSLVDIYTGGPPNGCEILNLGAFAVSGDRTKILASSIDGDGALCSFDVNLMKSTTGGSAGGAVSQILPTPDGARFFTTSENGTVGVFESATLHLLGSFQGQSGPGIYGAMMSLDGSTLFTVNSGAQFIGYDTTTFAAKSWIPNYRIIDNQQTIVPGAMDETGLIIGPIGHGVSFLDASQQQLLPVSPPIGLGYTTPDTGPAAGGTALQIPTNNASQDETIFPSLASAFIGDAPLSNAALQGAGGSDIFPPITGTTPASTVGTIGDVTATFANNDVSIMPEGFSYGPAIVEVVSNAGTADGGATGAIVGYGFGLSTSDVQVTVGGLAAPVTALYPYPPVLPYPYPVQGVQFTVPAGSVGPADIVVTTANGSVTATGAFHYVAAATSYPLSGANLQAGIYDPHRNVYYFSDGVKIQVLSLTGGWQTPITLPGTSINTFLLGLALSPDGSKLAIADYGDQKIYVLNPDMPGAAQIFTLPSPVDSGLAPCGLAILDTGAVYFATNDVDGDGAHGFHKLDTTSGTVTDFPDIGDGAGYDEFIRVYLSPDQTRVFSQIEGVSFYVDTATDTMVESPATSSDEGGNPEFTMSADGSTTAVNSFFTDSNLNAFSLLAYIDRETWLPVPVFGQKLDKNGSVFFQPLTDGIDVVDVQTGRLVNRVQLPVQLPSVYDALVVDGADEVVLFITANGVEAIDMTSSIPAPALRLRAPGSSASPGAATRIQSPSTSGSRNGFLTNRPQLRPGTNVGWK